MDERLISQALQDAARKDIPDDMELWPEVQARLGRATRTAARSRLSWVAVAILAMLAVSVVAYAASLLLQGGYLDPGMQGASEADLVTVLNMSKTIDGQTITLDYAYADSNRISFSLTASGTTPRDIGYRFGQIDLSDDAGHDFQSMFGGGGGGGGGGGSGPTPEYSTYSSNNFMSLDASVITDNPDKLNLHLVAMLGKYQVTPPDQSPDGASQETFLENLGPFVFDFTIPFIHGQVVEPNVRAVNNGQAILLKRLVIAPSFTRGLVCFDPVPTVDGLNAVISLSVDGEVVPLKEREIAQGLAKVEGDTPGCYDLQINQSLYGLPGAWALNIDSLREFLPVSVGSGDDGTSVYYRYDGQPDLLAKVRERLETALKPYGIDLTETDGGLQFTVPHDSGVDTEAIRQIANDVTQNVTPGPWMFTFPVPPMH